ncbi:MAG TPA: GtrA family protein [Flavihumibacter sp.]|jgi:putative flippase GtrA
MLAWLSQRITGIIDFFYPPFKRFIPLQTFRYLACGGGNTLLDLAIYIISHDLILKQQPVDLGFSVFGRDAIVTPHIMAFIMAFVVSFPLGFFLNKTVVFNDSVLRGRIQLVRYLLLVTACISLNYIFLKLFVEGLSMNAILAKVLTTVIVVCFSYVSQRHFTFKR